MGTRNVIAQKMNVDFIICGTQKGGTSALDVYLRGHPNICMAEKKEVHFFDNEDAFRNATPDYSQYHSVFKSNSSSLIFGEATTIYMYWREAPRRMWQYNPNLKLIVLLRNPIERAYSYVDRGFYLEQLRRLWSFFPKEQVLVLKSKELKCQPVQTLHRACEFLNVDPLKGIEPLDIHSRPYKSPMGAKELQFL